MSDNRAIQSDPQDVAGDPATSKARLRLWLKLLKATKHVEGELRENFRTAFDTTLPRFDVMAALDRAEAGLKMSELSSVLRVSNGNVTGIVDRLVDDGIHFRCTIEGGIARISHDRPERKNPFTFESYAELRDWFRALPYSDEVHAVVILPNGGNFSSGGDVHEIIGPLTKMDMKGLLTFTRMTGDLVKAMIHCGKPIIAAVDGVCAGAGAIMAMASDMRLATPEAKTAFLFNRVGLAGCDMGACAMLPRIIGQGRAAELLYTGRTMRADEGERWGFYNRVVEADALEAEAITLAERIVAGPTFANSMTKTMFAQEWAMTLDQAIEAEAQAQAICMQGRDFTRAYEAFVAKEKPVFEGD
jgi:enoyl-CoA hydratase/carnithine racemase